MFLLVLYSLIINYTLGSSAEVPQKKLISVVEFKTLPFGFPSNADRKEAIETGFYNESLVARPYGFAIYKDLVFLTMPRLDEPVPYSLSVVTGKQTKRGPEIKPFPNYEIHKNNKDVPCDRKVVSVFRPNIDECGQLWVIDTGRIGRAQVCPPKLMAFDPKTGKVLHKYTFPDGTFISGKSFFSNFVMRNTSPLTCGKSMFYITDPRAYRTVVYNQATKTSWFIEHPSFRPEEKYMNVTVNGTSFRFEDGIYQINLNETHLIYHPLASVSEFAIPLSIVNDESVWRYNPSALSCAVTKLGIRSAQWSASAIDSKTGDVYGCYTTPSAIYRWNTRAPYTEENQILVALNDVELQFCVNARILKNRDLYVMTTRLQIANTGTYNPNEINFRVLKCSLDGLRTGEACDYYGKGFY